jgi:hypothetical protein
MAVVLVLVIGTSALAFFGYVFVRLSRDMRHAKTVTVEVVQLSQQSRTEAHEYPRIGSSARIPYLCHTSALVASRSLR